MMRRINWTEPGGKTVDEREATEEELGNTCELVWEGSVQTPTFERFAVVEVTPLRPLS